MVMVAVYFTGLIDGESQSLIRTALTYAKEKKVPEDKGKPINQG